MTNRDFQTLARLTRANGLDELLLALGMATGQFVRVEHSGARSEGKDWQRLVATFYQPASASGTVVGTASTTTVPTTERQQI